jgi:tetratricopeptide (TPR) repeat protein
MRNTLIYKIFLAVILSAALLPVTAYVQKPTAKTFLDIGIINNQNAEYSEAIDEFKRAIELKPDYGLAYYHLGHAYFGLHRYDEAHNAFKNAAKYSPKHADSHYSLGMLASMLGNDSEAIDALNKAVKHNPKHLKAYSKLGDIYLDLEKYEDAIKTYEKILKIDSKSASARYHLGLAYIALSNKYISWARKQHDALKKIDKDFAKDLADKIRVRK